MSHISSSASKISSLIQLKQLHAHLIQTTLIRQNFWAAQFINASTRLRAPPRYVRCVFNALYCPNVFAFTSILRYYYRMDLVNQVFEVYERMKHCNVEADAYVYPILIKSAGEDGIMLLAQVEKLGHAKDPFVRNVIMDMYAKYGRIEVARMLFDEITERMVADWNVMISGYWNWGNRDEACRLFNEMPGCMKNVVTWTAMVSGFAKAKDLVSARKFFDKMPDKTVVSWNAMLSGYSQNGLAEEALGVFVEMMNSGGKPDDTTWVTVITSCSSKADPLLADSLVKMLNMKGLRLNAFVKTALLDMHAKCGSIEAARRIFDDLGVHRNVVSWNAMISAYARTGDWVSARKLFDDMPERNAVSWNSMMAAYAQNGQSVLAIELFKEMIKSDDPKPDEVTMITVLSACGHLGALELGTWAVKFLADNEIELSVSGYNALIFMYARCGNLNKARSVFLEIQKRDAISYNTLIAGYAVHGNGDETLNLLTMMKEENLKPDRVTYIGVLTACSHAGLLDQGRKVFESIKVPSVDHHACMVDMLGRVGKLEEAKKLIHSMPMAPHAGVYGSLLNASHIHKNVEFGEYAANKLFVLEPSNSGNYVLLSNIYASAGRWEDVARIREAMKRVGLNKTTGWSWVEHMGKMHKFIVGDRSHELSNDIYQLLAELRKKMRQLGYVEDKSCVLRDVEEEEKEEMVEVHSEKLAICFALIVSESDAVIRVVKNLRVCWDCHNAIKLISKLEGREIIVRDNNRFHHFVDGQCSCRDYW